MWERTAGGPVMRQRTSADDPNDIMTARDECFDEPGVDWDQTLRNLVDAAIGKGVSHECVDAIAPIINPPPPEVPIGQRNLGKTF